jgi:hypothetical protein
MFKDPNQTEETPYELLNLAPTATAAEVNTALPRFMKDRRNVAKIGRAQEALKRLKNPRERAEIDFWYYQIEAAEQTSDEMPEEQIEFGELPPPPVLQPQDFYIDLGPHVAASLPPIVPAKLGFVHIRPSDEENLRSLRPAFDR